MAAVVQGQTHIHTHTFLDQKPPMMPRQSTSDVLSFTDIIKNRLGPGENVWDYFSPPPSSSSPCSPLERKGSDTMSGPLSPTSPVLGGNKRQSILFATSPVSSPTSSEPATVPTPRVQKRRSFAQSFRSSIYSLSQLLSTANGNGSSTKSSGSESNKGPAHYNILVLGSDSAPLASTLYKMSGLLPNTSKINHYQEISGFFVAYFRSNGPTPALGLTPKTSSDRERRLRSSDEVKSRRTGLEEIDQEGEAENSSNEASTNGKRPNLPPINTHPTASTVHRSSQESNATLTTRHSKEESDSSTETCDDEADQATLYSPTGATSSDENLARTSSANASLSIHAFSLDTTWPVPRMLAQNFWFPHAHGIIYIVDATRKNDPRGMDHLFGARQFLSSLMADPHFKRRDIPVVVFANKAGMDDETCFRVDEIADILGCEEWEEEGRILMMQEKQQPSSGSSSRRSSADEALGSPVSRPWCVKSTRSDGEGEGLKEAVEWLKSRMGEIWKSSS
ncbi:hypothetical protein EMPS_08266 [Entomortierella parvispora]|uniref:Uncharacterized protein n=1 Tax=Entomortierella parvispora TaxID=205924 RepID=A0A9P3LZ83_9FUNG|nr:hypothetical protein EMPS_08266 [Entomortierella parvispora]